MTKLAEKQFGEPGTSWAAEEGTAAHWLFEDFVKRRHEKTAPNGIEITSIMRGHIYTALKTIKKEVDDPFFLEKEMKLQVWKELNLKKEVIWGTADMVAISRKGAWLIDLKYGKYAIYPKDNKQLMTYAVGILDLLHKYGKTELNLVISQPKLEHYWVGHNIPIREIYNWREKLKIYFEARKVREYRAMLTAGNHCFFCPAKPICPKHNGL